MGEKFDAVVIGSGLGGLAAALRLATEGNSVAVLERGNGPGGTASYHRNGGFLFPSGPLGYGNPGLVESYLDVLGLAGAVTHLPLGFQYRLPGVNVSLSPPPGDTADRFARIFPDDAAAVRGFFLSVRELNEKLFHARRAGASPALSPGELAPAGEFLSGGFSDLRLERLLGAFGTGEPRAGMPFVASLWCMLSGTGLAYPSGGFPALVSALVDALEATGRASLRTRTDVSRILVSGGRASGVVLDGGLTIPAGAVISNADVKTTYLELLDPADIPPRCLEAVHGAMLTGSGFHVSLGVDSSAVDLSAFDEGSRVIYRRCFPGHDVEPGVDWSVAEIDPPGLAGLELEVDLLSAEDGGVAPPGHSVILVRAPAPYAHFARFRPRRGRRSPAYGPYKERLARALVEEVSNILPGLAGSVSVIEAATPLTYEERGGRFEGAVAGWSPVPSQLGDGSLEELVRSPVPGLFLAGHQALSWMMLGGVPTALVTGLEAASAFLDRPPLL